VEPLTALLVIAASYGTRELVKILGGSAELSSLTGELVKSLAETESRIDERLAGIELKLDELLEQRYKVALRSGVRYLLDAIPAGAADKVRDLDRARDNFIEARSAAQSSLQEAVAERYLLLCLVGLRRTELVAEAVARLEGLAMSAAFQAMGLTEFNREQARALMQRECSSLRRLADRDRLREAQLQVKSAALDTICISGRLLGEAAVLGPTFGLPPRTAPPSQAISDPTLVEGPRNSRVGGSIIVPPRPRVPGEGYWTFTMRAGETLRIGPLSVQIRPGPARPSERRSPSHQHLTVDRAVFRHLPRQLDLTRQHLRLDLDWPLPLRMRVEVSTAGRQAPHLGLGEMIWADELAWNESSSALLLPGLLPLERSRDWSSKFLDSGDTWAELSIPPPKSGSTTPLLAISPGGVFRSLIEVTCVA
jgi:hypothetical protein